MHVAGAVNFRGVQLGRTISFSNDKFGYEKLLRWVHDLRQTHNLMQVIFGAESTGHYFLNLAFWLHERNEQIVLVNPMTTKRNKENRDNKPSKNDAKDAIIIADAISRGYYSEWVIRETIYRRLRYLVSEREAWVTDLSAIGNQLQTALDQSFPEFTFVFKEWNGPRGIATLQAFPLPSDLKDLTPENVIDGWRKAGMQRAGGSRGSQQAVMLLAAARRSVGLTDIAPEIKRQIGRLLQRYKQMLSQIETVEHEIHELLSQVPPSARQPLTEIGLSPLFVAVVLANAGDLSRYTHGRQLLALAGLSLAESTSGKRRGQIILSKRGRRQLRKYLYLAVIGLVANHPAFRRWHDHNVKTLKMKKQRSIFKLIGKLARILVALARSGETFVESKANALPPQAA
ncbi:IS110 family transposase [Paenibacillus sophorae]|nr:IS110 family transposase [Paenibacillus sophorae]